MRRAVAMSLAAVALGATPAAAQPPIVRPPEAPRSQLELGQQLYAANCATCHGIKGLGITAPAPRRGSTVPQGMGPPLAGVGPLAVDFYLRTGYMPLESPDVQPDRGRVLFSDREIQAMVEYVESLGPGGPPIPDVHPEQGSVSDGQRLFTEHCAGCHQVAAEGGVVTGARVPPLDLATPTQVAQAVRVGPFLMPEFPESQIDDEELNSIVAYVMYTQDPEDEGGWGINHLGPFPEGMVTWGIAAILVILFCMLLGERLRRS